MFTNELNGFQTQSTVVFCVLLCFFPLGVWKLVEIIIWAIHHIHIGLT